MVDDILTEYELLQVIDSDGYRLNVGIILSNNEGKLLWCRRVGNVNAWQFPQGGMREDETPEQAMFRELQEEIGLQSSHVQVLATTDDWLRYKLPEHLIRRDSNPLCIGQKQIWFLLKLLAKDEDVNLKAGKVPEFDQWCWIDYWEPMKKVVAFKRKVYEQALHQLKSYL